MQLDASFDDNQPQAGSWQMADITAPMEGLKQLLLIAGGNTDSAILHTENGVPISPIQRELHGSSFGRVLHRVGQQIAQDMAEQWLRASGDRECDRMKV